MWAIFIYALCMSSPSAFPKNHLFEIPYLDKWVHAFIFGILALLLYIIYKQKQNKNVVFMVLGICMLYGAVIECLQHYCTINRQGDFWDLLADGFGSLIAIFIAIRWRFTNK